MMSSGGLLDHDLRNLVEDSVYFCDLFISWRQILEDGWMKVRCGGLSSQ